MKRNFLDIGEVKELFEDKDLRMTEELRDEGFTSLSGSGFAENEELVSCFRTDHCVRKIIILLIFLQVDMC